MEGIRPVPGDMNGISNKWEMEDSASSTRVLFQAKEKCPVKRTKAQGLQVPIARMNGG